MFEIFPEINAIDRAAAYLADDLIWQKHKIMFRDTTLKDVYYSARH